MKINVGVLRGGVGAERDISLKSGGAALLALDREKYRPIDLYVDEEGVLHADGAPISAKNLRGIADVVLNLLHGKGGEDGTVQKILSELKVPHTGSGRAEVLDKHAAKKVFQDLGARTPFGVTFSLPKMLDEDFNDFVISRAKYAFRRIAPPWIVKPTYGGSSAGTFIARDLSELILAIKEVLRLTNHVLVEEYVRGREVTLGLVEGFRGEENYFLPVAELKKEKEILDEASRKSGAYRVMHPRLPEETKQTMKDFMLGAKERLGLKHCFTADFIVTPFGIYLLEIDALPALDEHAILPKKLEAVGASLSEFLDHIITRARR